jgi:hypothetical protein
MFLQQGILAQTFGVSGEKFLTQTSASMTGKLFTYSSTPFSIFTKDKSVIVHDIDSSLNHVYDHSFNALSINDVFIKNNILYICGKVAADASSNIFGSSNGFYSTIDMNTLGQTSIIINYMPGLQSCESIFFVGMSMMFIVGKTETNEIILTQYSDIGVIDKQTSIYQDDYVSVKGHYIVDGVIKIFVEVFNETQNVFHTKILSYDGNSVSSAHPFEDMSKNIFFQDVIVLNNVPHVVYIAQKSLPTLTLPGTLALPSNSVYISRLETPGTIANQFSIPNYFLDSVAGLQKQNGNVYLVGYVYNSSGNKMNYVSIEMNSSGNLDLSLEGTGYHVEVPVTTDYLIPKNKVESIIIDDSVYVITETNDKESPINKMMISKLFFQDKLQVFSSLENDDVIPVLDEYNIRREVTVIKPDINGTVNIPFLNGTEMKYIDMSSNVIILFSNQSIPNIQIRDGLTNLYSYYIKFYDNLGNSYPLSQENPFTLVITMDKYIQPYRRILFVFDKDPSSNQYIDLAYDQATDKVSHYEYIFHIIHNGLQVVSGSSGAGSIGSDPHVYTLFGKRYDLKKPSTRTWHPIFKCKDLNIQGHFTGMKKGIFFDKVNIKHNHDNVSIDFNHKSVKMSHSETKNSNISIKENEELKDIIYNNTTDNKKFLKKFVPKKMTLIEIQDENYKLNLYIDFMTRYLHFRFPEKMPRESECEGLLVHSSVRNHTMEEH